MSVPPSVSTNRISKEDFKNLAGEGMPHVFEIHNEFGRLFVEPIDKGELADRSACDPSSSAASNPS